MQRDDLLSQIRQLGGIEAKWLLPKTPDQPIRGRLYFADENLELEVEHGFQDIRLSANQWSLPVREVVGLLRDGTRCSLSELHVVSAESGRIVYTIQLALLGVTTDHPDQLKIRRLRLLLPIAADWAGLCCYETQLMGQDIVVRCSRPKTVSLGMADGVKLGIFARVAWEQVFLPSQAPTLKVSAHIRLSTAKQQALKTMQRYVPTIVAFFSLATLSPIRLDCLYCESDAAKLALPTNGSHRRKYYYQPIVVWYRGLSTNPSVAGLRDDEMFLTYSDLRRAGQTDVLSKILARHDEFDQLLPLMVPESGQFHTYTWPRFLNATQALETFDRMAGNNNDLDPSLFAATKKEILEHVRNPEPGWLEGLLKYANEPHLRARLKRAVEQNRSILHITHNSEKGFINDVINTRNYLVHHDKGLREKAVLDVRLFGMTDRLEALVRLSFLRCVGFSEENLIDLLQRTERQYIRDLSALF